MTFSQKSALFIFSPYLFNLLTVVIYTVYYFYLHLSFGILRTNDNRPRKKMKKTLKITLILTLLATTASGQGTSFGTPNTATISSIDSVMTDSVRVDSVAWTA